MNTPIRKQSRAPRPGKSNVGAYQAANGPSRTWDCLRLADTRRLAASLVNQRLPNLWLLRGPVGSGKTTFARAVARSLGYVGSMTSPTFVLRHDYSLRHPIWRRLVHVDAYRIKDRSEEKALDLETPLGDPTTLVLVEWPDNLGLKSGRAALLITFAHRPVGRRLTFSRRVWFRTRGAALSSVV